MGFSVGLPVYGIFLPSAGSVEVAVGADSDGVVDGVLLFAVVLGEGDALGAALRSSSGGVAGACMVVGASEGTVVVLVEDPGVADSGAGAVVLVVVLLPGVGVVVGWAAAIPPPDAISIDARAPMISDFDGDARFGHGRVR